MRIRNVASAMSNLCDHVRVRVYAASHEAVSVREFEQCNNRCAECGAGIGLQYGMDTDIAGCIQDRINPNLLNNPNGRCVSRLGQRLPGRDYALELMIEVSDPLQRTISGVSYRDGFVGYGSIQIECTLLKRR